jgi:hypothetical protein
MISGDDERLSHDAIIAALYCGLEDQLVTSSILKVIEVTTRCDTLLAIARFRLDTRQDGCILRQAVKAKVHSIISEDRQCKEAIRELGE